MFDSIAVAILRGVLPEQAVEVGLTLHNTGIRVIEVPLNSPQPFASITALAAARADWTIGAGTVLKAEDVRRVHDAGGTLIVSPNCDAQVIDTALKLSMRVIPGVASATEAFHAVAAGATLLKLFPASTYGPGHLRALRSVLPAEVKVLAVGGIAAADIAAWIGAGAAGFGFGSELFRPEYSLADIERRALLVMQSLQDACHTHTAR
jgi:2-dehydro-3-deoxyphosphogalactonate aldolase